MPIPATPKMGELYSVLVRVTSIINNEALNYDEKLSRLRHLYDQSYENPHIPDMLLNLIQAFKQIV